MVNKRLLKKVDEWKDIKPTVSNVEKIVPKQKERIISENSSDDLNLRDYIILQGRSHGNYEYPTILIGKKVVHKNNSWNHTQLILNSEGLFMPTVRQYVDFLNDLKSEKKLYSGNGEELNSIKRNCILEDCLDPLKGFPRGEFLDAKFNFEEEKGYITYHEIKEGNELKQIKEPLQPSFMNSKKFSKLDLSYWLNHATDQGLPPTTIYGGDLYYFKPEDNCALSIGVSSDHSLVLQGSTSLSFSIGQNVGVRMCKVLET